MSEVFLSTLAGEEIQSFLVLVPYLPEARLDLCHILYYFLNVSHELLIIIHYDLAIQ